MAVEFLIQEGQHRYIIPNTENEEAGQMISVVLVTEVWENLDVFNSS